MREYLNISSFDDRKGVKRWRFRKTGHKTRMLPGQPGCPEFEAAYDAILKGIEPPAPAAAPGGAEVVKHPSAIIPMSLRACWRIVTTKTPEWKEMSEESRDRQAKIAEKFFAEKVSEDHDDLWGDVLITDVKRRHIRAIIAANSDTPHAARHLLTVIRKMIVAAMDEDWIEHDPSHKVKHRPKYKGWRAWTDEERLIFERRWKLGTTPRLCYALALWLGNRRGDIAKLKPSAIKSDHVLITQGKTGRTLRLAITPMIREAFDAADMTGPAILMTAYGEPFSPKSLTGRMADWTKSAGLPPGCTLHGLRKTLGGMLADGGATTRQIMDTLGHTDIKHAELYTKSANQERLARDGLTKVVNFVGRGKIKSAG